jgi:hypothetical protein
LCRKAPFEDNDLFNDATERVNSDVGITFINVVVPKCEMNFNEGIAENIVDLRRFDEDVVAVHSQWGY